MSTDWHHCSLNRSTLHCTPTFPHPKTLLLSPIGYFLLEIEGHPIQKSIMVWNITSFVGRHADVFTSVYPSFRKCHNLYKVSTVGAEVLYAGISFIVWKRDQYRHAFVYFSDSHEKALHVFIVMYKIIKWYLSRCRVCVIDSEWPRRLVSFLNKKR